MRGEEPNKTYLNSTINHSLGRDSWDDLTHTALSRPAAVVVEDMIFVFGGSSSLEIFVANTKTETIRYITTQLPNTLYGASTARVGDYIYLCGGIAGGTVTNAILKFNIGTEKFETYSKTLPYAVHGASIGVIDNKIYLCGGFTGNSYNTPVDTIVVIDPTSDTVTTSAVKLPTKIGAGEYGGVVMDDSIYIVGGLHVGAGSAALYKFTPSENKVIKQSDDMGNSSLATICVAIDSDIVVIGAYMSEFEGYITTYDTITNTSSRGGKFWTWDFYNGAAVNIGHKIYTIGGSTGSSGQLTNYIYTLKYPYDVLNGDVLIGTNSSSYTFKALNTSHVTLTSGVSSVYRSVNYKKIVKETAKVYYNKNWIVFSHSPDLMTFKVDSYTYYAEHGMTWREFIDSDYNNLLDYYAEMYIDGNVIHVGNSYTDVDNVVPTDTIIAGTTYTVTRRSSGGSG